jgi:retron-type reverse transcriptase
MEQLELFVDRRNLFEKLHSIEFLNKGFKAVKKNKGAPGIDDVTIQDFEVDLDRNLRQLTEEIKDWRYPNRERTQVPGC